MVLCGMDLDVVGKVHVEGEVASGDTLDAQDELLGNRKHVIGSGISSNEELPSSPSQS